MSPGQGHRRRAVRIGRCRRARPALPGHEAIGALPANEGIKATVKLLGCFASFTLLYIALGVVFATQFGVAAGVAAALAAPACGYVAVLLSERVKRIGGAVAGARAVGSRHTVIDSVLAHRRSVVELAAGIVGGPAR